MHVHAHGQEGVCMTMRGCVQVHGCLHVLGGSVVQRAWGVRVVHRSTTQLYNRGVFGYQLQLVHCANLIPLPEYFVMNLRGR